MAEEESLMRMKNKSKSVCCVSLYLFLYHFLTLFSISGLYVVILEGTYFVFTLKLWVIGICFDIILMA